jgi:hypothetical protein
MRHAQGVLQTFPKPAAQWRACRLAGLQSRFCSAQTTAMGKNPKATWQDETHTTGFANPPSSLLPMPNLADHLGWGHRHRMGFVFLNRCALQLAAKPAIYPF